MASKITASTPAFLLTFAEWQSVHNGGTKAQYDAAVSSAQGTADPIAVTDPTNPVTALSTLGVGAAAAGVEAALGGSAAKTAAETAGGTAATDAGASAEGGAAGAAAGSAAGSTAGSLLTDAGIAAGAAALVALYGKRALEMVLGIGLLYLALREFGATN